MKNISKLLLTIALLVSAGAVQAYNEAATKQLRDLLFMSDRAVPTHIGGATKWSFEDGQKIKSLIEQGADPNVDVEPTPLFAAIYSNNPDAVESVVNAGADLTKEDPLYGYVPLVYYKVMTRDNRYLQRNPRILQFLESVSEKSKL